MPIEQNNTSQSNNKRIAKNTILLYIRTLFILFISLYTSRVILNQLGVEDYGIYNVVGGVVGMFAVISSALSSAISRFITFELGRNNIDRLKPIFSTSVNIQIGIAIIVLLICEAVGVWFLNCKMTIPAERMTAANWVLQFSLLVFCINLISVPYNACIIAHEHMTAFAYISVFEAVLKLLICFMLTWSSFDKLITYAFLMLCVAIIIRLAYGIYCSRHFEESHYHWTFDRSILKEMTSFAGWSFFTNLAWIFNTQGVNLLVNAFFGVTLNAARGIATQVEGAVIQFVNNFTTAINPQITKCYAANQKTELFTLICRGAKFSYFLLLVFALPIILETEYILTLWLKIVPEYTVVFVRLSLIGATVNILGNSCYTACMATGNIRNYSIWVTTVGLFVFPMTWIAYQFGMPAEATYIIYILVYVAVDATRLIIMRELIQFPVRMFIKGTILPITLTTIICSIVPVLFYLRMPTSFLRLVVVSLSSVISVSLSVAYIGLTKHERQMTVGKILAKLKFKR